MSPRTPPLITNKSTFKRPPEPRLCPICWRDMKITGKDWECPKHGKPDRP